MVLYCTFGTVSQRHSKFIYFLDASPRIQGLIQSLSIESLTVILLPSFKIYLFFTHDIQGIKGLYTRLELCPSRRPIRKSLTSFSSSFSSKIGTSVKLFRLLYEGISVESPTTFFKRCEYTFLRACEVGAWQFLPLVHSWYLLIF